MLYLFFYFNDTPPTEIYTLSLHDALPILAVGRDHGLRRALPRHGAGRSVRGRDVLRHVQPEADRVVQDHDLHESAVDRKSTRLNSSHPSISYAVFCLKKKIIYQLNIYY